MIQRFGVISVWVGIVASVLGLALGFAKLFSGNEADAGAWLGLIPVGFALMLLGVAITQLSKK